MDKKIIYRDESNGDITICRNLCNRLMEHQALQTENELYREIYNTMCFENRLLPSFQNATEKQLIIAYDEDIPVGYVYSSAEWVTEELKEELPAWAYKLSGETQWLYPEWLQSGMKIGDLNNLYVLPEYRGYGIGQELMKKSMAWLQNIPDAEWIFVFVANGNPVETYYEQYGFRFSHKVLGGIIEAYCQRKG